MDPEAKKKWCKALRSGKYAQGFGTLRTDDNKYCCLGVLALVVGDGEDLKEQFEGKSSPEPSFTTANKSSDRLVNYRKTGINSAQENQLSWANDSRSTFAEIADAIESPEFETDIYSLF